MSSIGEALKSKSETDKIKLEILLKREERAERQAEVTLMKEKAEMAKMVLGLDQADEMLRGKANKFLNSLFD